jgi:hypothetical protein
MANSKVVTQAAKKYAICFAPSEYVAQGPAKSFGWWAESYVMLNYLKKTAAVPFVTDFFDLQSPVKGIGTNPITDGPVALFKFLCRHHPPLAKLGDEWNLNFLAGKSAVPDILTAKPTRHDYYEVKPASDSGKNAGKTKLGKLVALFNDSRWGLQAYKAGTFYTPRRADDVDITPAVPRIVTYWAKKLGIRTVKVTLRFRRDTENAGLILYQICLEIESDLEIDSDIVANVSRWYALHSINSLKKNVPPTDADAAVPLKVAFAHQAVARLMPSEDSVRAAILAAGPATEYAIVGGPLALQAIRAIEKADFDIGQLRAEAFKKMTKVGVPGLPQLYANPTAIARGNFDYEQQATFLMVGTAVVCVVVVVAAVVIIVATGGAAAVPVMAGASEAGLATGLAVDTAVITAETVAEREVVKQVGIQAVKVAARRIGPAVARSKAAQEVVAAAAGVLLVLALSKDAAASGNANRPPSITEIEPLRLVPTSDVADFATAGPLGSITLPGGSKGFKLGSIQLSGGAELVKLDANTPPAD